MLIIDVLIDVIARGIDGAKCEYSVTIINKNGNKKILSKSLDYPMKF
jgi:hypothetical protein